MDYYTASREVKIKRLIGFPLMTIGFLLFLMGSLQFIDVGFDGAVPAVVEINHPLKRLAHAIYDSTQFLEPLWQLAPVPDPRLPLSPPSIFFGFCYMAGFLGASLLRSASRLAERLRGADRAIEDELMRESLRSKQPRTLKKLKEQTQVPKQSVWKEIHTLYIAPLIVLLVGAVLLKLLGLT
jgi:hypothetical protein